jgi:TRAP-type C4-dicarboxylate transport system permease small subunit|tara:strand:+ start:91 stop:621 length:531 start_codon:yes stop_codon:yes gene_type:complete
MRRAITNVSDFLDRACRTGAGLCFFAMLAMISLQVVARYIFQSPPTWTEEMARFAMVWGGLLGAAVAFKHRFDPTLIKPPESGSKALMMAAATFRTAAVVIFMAPVLYFSIIGPGSSMARGFIGRSLERTADTLGFPMFYVAIAVPIAATVILIHLAARLAGDKTGVIPPEQENAK